MDDSYENLTKISGDTCEEPIAISSEDESPINAQLSKKRINRILDSSGEADGLSPSETSKRPGEQFYSTPRLKNTTNDSQSFLISDSDDEIDEKSNTENIYIRDSSSSSSDKENDSPNFPSSERSKNKQWKKGTSKFIDSLLMSEESTSIDEKMIECSNDSVETDKELSESSNNHGLSVKRKDVTHDDTRLFREDFKSDISKSSVDNSRSDESIDAPKERSSNSSECNADSASGGNMLEDSMLAISLVEQEIPNRNIDARAAQEHAFLLCKEKHLRKQLTDLQLLRNTMNVNVLPDNGEKVEKHIADLECQIKEINSALKSRDFPKTVIEKFLSSEYSSEYSSDATSQYETRSNAFEHATSSKSHIDLDESTKFPSSHADELATNSAGRSLGKRAQATHDKQLSLTMESLQQLHGSLVTGPKENELMEDPPGLKVKLMPHQQHALAWCLWREKQKPSGGILADDMGLGKTLTMISVILKTVRDVDEFDDTYSYARKKATRSKGGTLIVCPATLLAQWEGEIKNRCKRGLLSVQVHHGHNREIVPSRLAEYDVVITTYNILSRGHKNMSILFKLEWKRVILDEAHTVRNHKSQSSVAVCAVRAQIRWALTGTPIHNKEMDMYAIFKFLQCVPFDDLRIWKRWVNNNNVSGHQRLATVMKTLMLRRTKHELQTKGDLNSLPKKYIEEVLVILKSSEQLVYQKVLVYSRTLFAQFLNQRAETQHMMNLHAGKYDKPTYNANPNQKTEFTKAQDQLLAIHAGKVKSHEILVLLLRLRQICCHPALIHSMLDREDMQQNGLLEDEPVNDQLLSQMNNITLDDSLVVDDHKEAEMAEEEEEAVVDDRLKHNILTAKNPVFNKTRISTKMRSILDKVQEILERKGDKLVIVSQWPTFLDVVASHLPSLPDATFKKYTGQVAVKDRQAVQDSFNTPNSPPRILLLSLTAGGVGLNLVGGNHLLLIDNHWNPQLESQAQDRIYRFGQTKDVYIYKFVCKNTIEERIKKLQEHKLSIADNVLSGNTHVPTSKLTLEDLKSLFEL